MTKTQSVEGERGQWSAKARREAVLRLLRGEAIDAPPRELRVTAGTNDLANGLANIGLPRENTGYAQSGLPLGSLHAPVRGTGMRPQGLRVPRLERRIEAAKLPLLGFPSEGHA